MTDSAVIQGTSMSLQGDVLEIVVCLVSRQDSVGAAVTSLAVEAAMSHGVPVALAGILGILSRMTSGAAWEIDPRPPSWIRHISGRAVTVYTVHPTLVHDIPQALGLLSRMAVVAVVRGAGDLLMLLMHRQRQVWQLRVTRHPQRVSSQ